MHRRNAILFSLFMLVAITATLLVYFYQRITDRMVDDYVAGITTCGNITSEGDCYARDFCEGIYGPNCVGCEDLTFLRCENVSAQTEAALSTARNRCEATGGTWFRNRLGSFCLCQSAGANMMFNPDRGCVAQATTP